LLVWGGLVTSIEKQREGGAFALSGRLFIQIKNNQMEDGFDVRGCG
jgi:hypothetical protein